MGIDTRIKRDKKYCDRCKYYKGQIAEEDILLKRVECTGVFYSTDKINYNVNKNNFNGVAMVKNETLTLETPDYIPDLEVDDFVKYVDGNLWRVNNIEREDDNDAKWFSNRPQTLTIISLIR